jgi:hypothetical protein|nr:MAG TPA: hypothetical protein [Caudoviricetes sp.]
MFSIKNLMGKANNFLNTINSINRKTGNLLKKVPPIILGDINLELISDVNESYQNDVPVIPIDDGTQISDNISQNPLTLSFKVLLAGDNHKEIFEKILQMRDKRELVDLYMIKLYKNLAITGIEVTIESLYYIEFTISFVQVQIANIQMIPSPSKEAKPVVSKKAKIKTKAKKVNISKTNVSKINKVNNSWEGDLQSESIKLPSS